MTVLMANIALAIPFLVVFAGVPLWMTTKHPDTGADHAEAHRYLRARAAQAQTAQAQTAQAQTAQAQTAQAQTAQAHAAYAKAA